MAEKGYERDTLQRCVKIKELQQGYQKARESNRCSYAEPKTCCFYKALEAILGGNATSIAKRPVDTFVDPEAADPRLNPYEEVMAQVKLEDDAKQGLGCLLPWELGALLYQESPSPTALVCRVQDRGAQCALDGKTLHTCRAPVAEKKTRTEKQRRDVSRTPPVLTGGEKKKTGHGDTVCPKIRKLIGRRGGKQ